MGPKAQNLLELLGLKFW